MSCILLCCCCCAPVSFRPVPSRSRLPFVFAAPLSHLLLLRLQRLSPFFLLFLLPFICTKRRDAGTKDDEDDDDEDDDARYSTLHRRVLRACVRASVCVCVFLPLGNCDLKVRRRRRRRRKGYTVSETSFLPLRREGRRRVSIADRWT